MVHTLPPWTSKWRMATIFGQIDSGELAARLGSINTFDRRGNVLWMDDFEDNIDKWALLISEATGSIALSTATARNGATSAKLTTGPTILDFVRMWRLISYPQVGKFGLETSFTVAGNKEIYKFSFYYDNGTVLKLTDIEYDSDTDLLRYTDSGGVWQDIATSLDLHDNPHLFHTMKLVCDFENDEYIRLLLDKEVYPLTDVALNVGGVSTSPHLFVEYNFINGENASKTCYIDDVIVTQNEP